MRVRVWVPLPQDLLQRPKADQAERTQSTGTAKMGVELHHLDSVRVKVRQGAALQG